jgi:hypothetical protein
MSGPLPGSSQDAKLAPGNASLCGHPSAAQCAVSGPLARVPITDSPPRSPRNVGNTVAYDLLDLITRRAGWPLRLYRFREEHDRNPANKLSCGVLQNSKADNLILGSRHVRRA